MKEELFNCSSKKMNRSWTEISIDKVLRNYSIYKESIPKDKRIMAVVKADAYGHGDAIISKVLSDNGVRFFAVSNIDEAIHIRKAGTQGMILILGYTPIHRAKELLDYKITQSLLSEEYAEKLSSISNLIECQFAIDTGMRRIGLNADMPSDCERIIRKYSSILRVNGIFTHLCSADSPEEAVFTNEQMDKFNAVSELVSDLNLPYCHCLNSAGGLEYGSSRSCFVRLGIILYGLKPGYAYKLPGGIEPSLSWKSVVCMVKSVKPGDTIGYGRSFSVRKHMRVATIPTGYADGYNRLLSNKGFVLINGKKAHILGRICMDQMMVDVSDIPNVELGSEVILIGRSGNEMITADDIANMYGSIGYEVVCGISKRVERVYI